MKHLKSINEYFSNINEGINYNHSVNADLYDVGHNVLQGSGKTPDDMGQEDVEKAALEAMKKAKPVSLTGNIKKDLPAFLKYVGDAFKKCGVDLDTANTEIDSSNFANELMIPIANTDYYLNTMLDYAELAYNGSDFVVSASFASDDMGALDYMIDDLSNNGDIVKACAGFKKYMESQK
jgi:hypothetical protein